MIAQVTALLLAPLAAYSAERTGVLDRQWVALGSSGKLEYKTTAKGDRIMDFSHAGYMGGGVAHSIFPVKKEVAPSGGDDSAAIQADTYLITDKCVSAGTLSLSVRDAKGLAVGDNVCIRWPRSAKRIHFMGMDKLVRNGKPQTWIKKDSQATMDRLIRAIDGNRITLDVPLTEAIDAQSLLFEMPPGALNLAIGCKGEPGNKSSKEEFFSANKPITPASLDLAQLREGLGEMVVKTIGY